jgi:hypothetical protein
MRTCSRLEAGVRTRMQFAPMSIRFDPERTPALLNAEISAGYNRPHEGVRAIQSENLSHTSKYTWVGSSVRTMKSAREKMLRKFRRLVLKVREAIAAVPDDARLHASISVRDGRLAVSEFEKPDEASKVRMAVLMRPLLDPESDIQCRRVWNLIKSTREFDEQTIANVEKSFRNIEDGGIPVVVNQRRMGQREIYEIFAQGEFFNRSKDAVAMLETMRFGPMTPMLWMAFYGYTHDMVRLASMLLDVASVNKSIEASDTEIAVDLGPCVYCLKSDGPFTSEEHIIPEGFGNDDAVLSRGFVCDPCNNSFSVLDEYLLNFEAVSFQRVLAVPFTKKGKLPRAEFRDLTIEKRMPRVISMIHKKNESPHVEYREFDHQPDGTFRWELNVKGKKPTDLVRVGRALYKIGLGMVALQAGREHAMLPRYDATRDFIAGRMKSFDNNLAIITKTTPHGGVRFYWWPGEVGTLCMADFYGVVMVFNLELLPPIEADPNDEFAAQFAVIPLR